MACNRLSAQACVAFGQCCRTLRVVSSRLCQWMHGLYQLMGLSSHRIVRFGSVI
jgi:hypothetical protein